MSCVTRFQERLKSLKSKNPINDKDFLTFVRTIAALAKEIEEEKGFANYGPVLKEWIGAFEIIFHKDKVSVELKNYMSKLCSVVTETYLKLLLSIHEFDRSSIQEFYGDWKEILSFMKASKRATSFIRHINQLKVIVRHLRIAEQRCEQLAILNVLSLYTEQVPLSELNNLKVHFHDDNVYIFERLIQLWQQPSIISHHEFLHHIHPMGDCILSFKPIKIVCEKLAILYSIPEYEMWIDFNMKQKSIMLVAKSVTNDADECMAIASRSKLKENFVNNECLMTVQGIWNISTRECTDSIGTSVFTFHFHNHVRNMIFESKVRSVFKILQKSNTYSSCGESSSKDKISETPSKRCRRDVSVESSILILPSDASVFEWKSLSEAQLSGKYNRKCLISPAAVGQQPYQNSNGKSVNLTGVDHLVSDGGINDLEYDKAKKKVVDQQFFDEMESKPEEKLMEKYKSANHDVETISIKVTVNLPKEPTFEKIAKSLPDRNENIAQQQLVDYQDSQISFCDDMSIQGAYSDDELENSNENFIGKGHHVDDDDKDKFTKDIATISEPLLGKIVKSSPENIRIAVMPFSLPIFDDDQSSGISFCDDASVQEAYSDNESETSRENFIEKGYHNNDGDENMFTKDTLPEGPIFEKIRKSSRDRNGNIKKAEMTSAQYQLVDYQDSEIYSCFDVSLQDDNDEDKFTKGITTLAEPILREIEKSSPEIIKHAVMPVAQQQLVDYQSSETSFHDDASVQEAYNNNDKNSHKNLIEKDQLMKDDDYDGNTKDTKETTTLSEESIFDKIAKSSSDQNRNIKHAVMPVAQQQLVDYQDSETSSHDDVSVQGAYNDNDKNSHKHFIEDDEPLKDDDYGGNTKDIRETATLSEEPLFGKIAKSSSGRNRNIKHAVMPVAQQKLVDYQDSETSSHDGVSVQEAYNDNDKNSHKNFIEEDEPMKDDDYGGNTKDIRETAILSEEPIIDKIAKSSSDRNRNIKHAIMPVAQRKLVDYQDSETSLHDDVSVQEAYNDNELKNSHENFIEKDQSVNEDDGNTRETATLSISDKITKSSPFAQQQLVDYQSSGTSFRDVSAYSNNRLENALKRNFIEKEHLGSDDEHIEYMEYSTKSLNEGTANMQKSLTTLTRHEQMKLPIRIASEQNESNNSVLESVSNDTNESQTNDSHLPSSSTIPIVYDNNVIHVDSTNSPCQNEISSPKLPPLNVVPLNSEVTQNQAAATDNNLSQVLSVDGIKTVQTKVPEIVMEDYGYEFANDEELQTASRFYIDNDGLNYLRSKNFKKLNPTQQKIKERQFRTIYKMMNRGLDALHRNDKKESRSIDPYGLHERKSSKSNKVSRKQVTFAFPEQSKSKLVESKKPSVSTTRRRIRNISLLDDNDDVDMMETTSSKTRQQLNKHKIADVSKTSKSRSVKSSSYKNTKTSSRSEKIVTDNAATTPSPLFVNNEAKRQRRVPIYAKPKMIVNDSMIESVKGKFSPLVCLQETPTSTIDGNETDLSLTANKRKIEILSIVNPTTYWQVTSSQKMSPCQAQDTYCHDSSCNILFNNLNELTKEHGLCDEHKKHLMQLTDGSCIDLSKCIKQKKEHLINVDKPVVMLMADLNGNLILKVLRNCKFLRGPFVRVVV